MLAQAEDLALAAEYHDIGLQGIAQHLADIVEDEYIRRVVMQQLVDLACLVKELYAHISIPLYQNEYINLSGYRYYSTSFVLIKVFYANI